MAQQNELDQLRTAWRALSYNPDRAAGWSTIRLLIANSRELRAGRYFPGNEESLLVRFGQISLPSNAQLPQGHGFHVSQIDLDDGVHGSVWLALSRRPSGSLEMFTLMVLDIIATLKSGAAASEERLFQLFLVRIRAWQEFMRRGADAILAPDAEVGLYGELVIIRTLLQCGIPAITVINGWVGPLHAVHDFQFGTGAIEVKTTISTSGFRASIGSLDQLDDSLRQPLFIAAVRLCQETSGLSLPNLVESMRASLEDDLEAQQALSLRLLHAGYLDSVAEHYKRSFVHRSTRLMLVNDGFPRLVRSFVPFQIIRASYDLDLDSVICEPVALESALLKLGVS